MPAAPDCRVFKTRLQIKLCPVGPKSSPPALVSTLEPCAAHGVCFVPFPRPGVSAADFGFDQPVVQVVFEIAQDAVSPVVAVDQVA